ncbi:MAG: hypothetical protein A3F10_06675 [Coxiella sp. RIFCSPHIGHO2_12_FULL_42_15]|nr:MAG: hypothetical protein A3F10_06675 [Coxiella sp. RIFCSPHIGHO2_12_FULL_42_15]
MFKLKNEPQRLGGVISDSFCLVAHSWVANIVVVLMAIVGSFILFSIFGSAAISLFIRLLGEKTPHWETINVVAMMPNSYTIAWLVAGLFLTIWFLQICNAIMVRVCWNVASIGHAKLGNAFAVGFKYFYVYLLQLLVIIAVMAVMYGIQYLLSLFHQDWLNAIIAILTQMGIYYILLKLILVNASAVIDLCGFRGFARAWNFTSGHWWRTLGSLVFSYSFYLMFIMMIGLGIITLVLMPGLNPVFGSNLAHMMAHMPDSGPMWFGIIMMIFTILTFLAIIFTVPTMMAANQAMIYNDIKYRHNGHAEVQTEYSHETHAEHSGKYNPK